MPTFAGCKPSRPVALVIGYPDKAKRVAADYGFDPKHIYDYQSIDRLADDPAITYRGLQLTVGSNDGREQKQTPEVNHFSECVADG